MGYGTVKSVVKAMAILELLTAQTIDDTPLALAEVAKRTGILPVTARNLLRTLEECGYASRVGHGKYREGERCLKLFKAEGVLHKLKEVAKPLIDRMVFELGESLLLVSVIHNRRVELVRSKTLDDPLENPQWSANALCYQMRTTRAILAWFSKAQLEAFVEVNGLPAPEDWPECGNNLEKLKIELKKIRTAGGCCDEHGGYMAIAIPIMTVTNEVVASLGCYSQISRTDHVRAAGIFKLLQDCAAVIQKQMENRQSSLASYTES